MSRNRARVVAMQALFLLDSDPEGMAQTAEARAEEEMLDGGDVDYVRALMERVGETRERLDDIIREYSVDWEIERLGKVERTVLRIALAEALYFLDVPANAAISEAVRIAKKYGTEHSGKFVNGVLGKFWREGARLPGERCAESA